MGKDLVFGRTPFPGYLDHQAKTANKPEGIGWDNVGLWGVTHRTPKFIVIHRMEGTLAGTDSYFPNPSVGALTDYGIGTANIDGKALDGVIYQWNDPRGYRVGWSSGPVSKPFGDGAKWLNWSGNRYGLSICNVCGVSMEDSGNYTDSMTDFAVGELAKFIAYWFDQFGVAWDKAPIHPETGFSAITWHTEWTAGTGKVCPGKWLMDRTQHLIDLAQPIMKAYQTGEAGSGDKVEVILPPAAPKPKYAKPDYIADLAELGKDDDHAQSLVVREGTKFIYVGDRVKATKATRRLQHADVHSPRVGPDLSAGDEFDVLWQFTANDGKDYYYTPWATRVLVADCARVSDTPSFAEGA